MSLCTNKSNVMLRYIPTISKLHTSEYLQLYFNKLIYLKILINVCLTTLKCEVQPLNNLTVQATLDFDHWSPK